MDGGRLGKEEDPWRGEDPGGGGSWRGRILGGGGFWRGRILGRGGICSPCTGPHYYLLAFGYDMMFMCYDMMFMCYDMMFMCVCKMFGYDMISCVYVRCLVMT